MQMENYSDFLKKALSNIDILVHFWPTIELHFKMSRLPRGFYYLDVTPCPKFALQNETFSNTVIQTVECENEPILIFPCFIPLIPLRINSFIMKTNEARRRSLL